jgi:GalNAc-alpha-(1->4)-GalNAc-alpha-(1->3)-diNAcBac-PP-undecaprenol alpha-1,4-N-acetyl-D-galactosaminyltransferase
MEGSRRDAGRIRDIGRNRNTSYNGNSLSPTTTRADRITLVVASLGGGGAERVAVDLSRYLRDSGREIALVTLNGDDPDAYLVPDGIRRERLDIRRAAASPLDSIRFTADHLAAMRRRIVSTRPDAVVSFLDQTNVRTVACLVGSGIPVIVSERTHPGHHPLSRVWQVARRLTYPLADAVVVQTADVAAWIRRQTRVKRLVVISNAARYDEDLRQCDRTDSNVIAIRPLVLAVGRMTREKGFDLLLEAFHRSRLAESGWHLAIAGEGVERAALLEQATSLGIANALTLPGRVNDVGRWLVMSDIFVLSSRYEGFPNALLEAMQTARACVSFDCPSGPSELVEDGRNGLLIKAEDVDGLSAALRRLASDPELRRRLGAEASRVAREFSPASVYGKWLALIDAVAAGNAAAMFSPAALDAASRD